jgi:hypothetical protein
MFLMNFPTFLRHLAVIIFCMRSAYGSQAKKWDYGDFTGTGRIISVANHALARTCCLAALYLSSNLACSGSI